MPGRERRRGNALRFLVAAVLLDVVVAAVLRVQYTDDFLRGARDWRTVLGMAAAAYVIVVLYALVRVVWEFEWLRGHVRGQDGRIAAIEETSGDWLWETTPDLVLTYSSRQLTQVLGYAPDEVIGRSAREFMTAGTAKQVAHAVETGALLHGWHEEPSEWVTSDGHAVVLLHSGVALRDPSGRLAGFRGSCRPVDPGPQHAERRDAVSTRIREVVTGPPITMALQPIIEVATGRIVGAEALSRFGDGRPPNLWFDEAGEVGLRYELETHALQGALARLHELPDDVWLSVNACPEVITNPSFPALLQASGLPLDRLVLEVTEHVRIDTYDQLLASLLTLRNAGVRVAVDDAGAGYASLTHVLNLRPDIVKLDRSLVANVQADRARRTLITALTLLAMDIGATVTAEGVETAAELETLSDLGVDHAQGYLIGRPTVDIQAWARDSATPGSRS